MNSYAQELKSILNNLQSLKDSLYDLDTQVCDYHNDLHDWIQDSDNVENSTQWLIDEVSTIIDRLEYYHNCIGNYRKSFDSVIVWFKDSLKYDMDEEKSESNLTMCINRIQMCTQWIEKVFWLLNEYKYAIEEGQSDMIKDDTIQEHEVDDLYDAIQDDSDGFWSN